MLRKQDLGFDAVPIPWPPQYRAQRAGGAHGHMDTTDFAVPRDCAVPAHPPPAASAHPSTHPTPLKAVGSPRPSLPSAPRVLLKAFDRQRRRQRCWCPGAAGPGAMLVPGGSRARCDALSPKRSSHRGINSTSGMGSLGKSGVDLWASPHGHSQESFRGQLRVQLAAASQGKASWGRKSRTLSFRMGLKACVPHSFLSSKDTYCHQTPPSFPVPPHSTKPMALASALRGGPHSGER